MHRQGNSKERRNASIQKNQTQQQFLIRKVGSKASNKSSSTNSSVVGAPNKKPGTPRDGKVLEILNDFDMKEDQQIIEGHIKSFSLYNSNTQSLMAMESDVRKPLFQRQITFNAWYHPTMWQNLKSFENHSYAQSLRKHRISHQLRAKMVDWMLEVFGNYKTTTTNFTFFRSVNLMDQFLKSTQRVYGDSDLHLIGIGCMFIASKIEDVYHIPMVDMVKRVAHNKFSIGQIKQVENDIMLALQFNVYFPTHLNYLSSYFFKCFCLSDNPHLTNIYETAIYVLKMALHDYNIVEVSPSILAAASLCYSLHEYMNTKRDEKIDEIKIVNYSSKMIQTVCDCCGISLDKQNDCFRMVKSLVDRFQKTYPELGNLERFG